MQDVRGVGAERQEQAVQFYGQEVQPVFRSSPFMAEEQRQEAQRATANILFIDEGNCCRYIDTPFINLCRFTLVQDTNTDTLFPFRLTISCDAGL